MDEKQLSDIKRKFSVLVVSCDKYSDLWLPFFELFWRFWPDCPFNVYLLSNNMAAHIPKVKPLLVGDDLSWSDNLIKALNQLNEEYVLIFLDDLLLLDHVKTDDVVKIVGWVVEKMPNYLRMNPYPRADKSYNELVGIVLRGTVYRTATVMAVWKRDILLNLLRPGENAWEFEICGTVRSDCYDKFYATWTDYFPIVNSVIKGKWRRRAIRKLRSLRIEIDLEKREVMTFGETLILYFKLLRSRALTVFPRKYRRKIRDYVLRGGHNYKST